MKRNGIFLLVAFLALGLSPLTGDDKSPKSEKKYAIMPWHLVDLWWDIGKEVPFESYSIDVTISEDLPPSSNLYIAPVGRRVP